MILFDLIKSNAWLSVKHTLEKLYPDQSECWVDYEKVFHQLQFMQPKESNTTIEVTWVHDDFDNSDYVDVSGYYTNPAYRTDKHTNSLALEFTRWEEWLGMPIDKESLETFSELELIAHCLNEMTFAGFEQEKIQAEMDRINKIADDYDKMTPEERKKNTYTWEEVKERYGINFENDDTGNQDKEDNDVENQDND
jgi:hypothetical protein